MTLCLIAQHKVYIICKYTVCVCLYMCIYGRFEDLYDTTDPIYLDW